MLSLDYSKRVIAVGLDYVGSGMDRRKTRGRNDPWRGWFHEVIGRGTSLGQGMGGRSRWDGAGPPQTLYLDPIPVLMTTISPHQTL